MGTLCPHCRSRFDEDDLERCPHDKKRLVPDRSGQTITDRYTLRELLGVGGMDSSVWMAWQTSTQRSVAVKILPPVEGDAAERFARGGRIASNLNHPNITTVHDYGRTETGELYLVMELLEGVTLYKALRKTPFPLERTVHVVDQVLRALGHAHRRSVVHRDIKLSNLFLTPRDDDPDFVKVLDFGIARFVEEPPEGWADNVNNEITTTRQLCGTPQYMAPEQIGFGKIDARADLYATGVATYRMITGRFPFQGTPHDQFRAHLQSKPPPFAQVRPDLNVPPEVEAWVMRALEKDPDNRFASAEEMRTALRSIRKRLGIAAGELEDSSVRSAPYSRGSSASWAGEAQDRTTQHVVPENPRRSRAWIWAALITLLLVVAIGLLLSRQPSQPRITSLAPDEASTTERPAEDPPASDTPAAAADAAAAAAADAAVAADQGVADAAAKPTRTVRITSRPSGATVERGGEGQGRTPLELALEPGQYVFKLSRRGHRDAAIRVDVGADGGDEVLDFLGVLEPLQKRDPVARPERPRPPTPAEPESAPEPEPAAEPEPAPAVAAPVTPKKPAEKGGTVRMQLLDEDEARAFDVGGKKKPPPANPTGEKPAVDLID